MTDNRILLIPEKTDEEFDSLFDTWAAQGGIIKKLGKYWIRDEALVGAPITIYGNQTFALILAQIYHVELLSPDDALMATIRPTWTKRKIQCLTKDEAEYISYPVFIKPVIPKLFLASIFPDYNSLLLATQGLAGHELLLVSVIVGDIIAEARSFVLNGDVMDIALYEGTANLASGKQFVEAFLKQHQTDLPHSVVVDIAYSTSSGWMILEFNACWGAGLNYCQPEKVIPCIKAATVFPEAGTLR